MFQQTVIHFFCVSERSERRMTRSLKNAVLQQQKFDVDKALQILDQETPPLVVDGEKLKVCGILWASGLFSSSAF